MECCVHIKWVDIELVNDFNFTAQYLQNLPLSGSWILRVSLILLVTRLFETYKIYDGFTFALSLSLSIYLSLSTLAVKVGEAPVNDTASAAMWAFKDQLQADKDTFIGDRVGMAV